MIEKAYAELESVDHKPLQYPVFTDLRKQKVLFVLSLTCTNLHQT